MAASASLFLTLVMAPSRTMAATALTTKEEIINFQKSHGLKPDGIIGKRTRAALRADSKKKDVNVVNNPIENNPTAPVVSIKKVAFRPKKVVKVEEKCQFLFWDVSCNSEKDNTNSSDFKLGSPARKAPVQKGMTMVGLNARSDRRELEGYFKKKIEMSVDPVRIPWCAAWANAVLADTGYATTASLQARSFLHYGTITKTPQEGDIVVFARGRNSYAGHVGFYLDTVTMGGKPYIAVLGGNQNKAVSIAYYPASRVLGYRKPVAV